MFCLNIKIQILQNILVTIKNTLFKKQHQTKVNLDLEKFYSKSYASFYTQIGIRHHKLSL
jgi:hypothetical protein